MEAATVTGNWSLQRQAGFTYIGMLIAVAVMGVWLAATSNVLHQSLRRDKESELLFIGHQFRAALDRYAKSSQGNPKRAPSRLEDLLLDERFPEKKRHLRRIFVDPMTGQAEWGLVRNAAGQIVGVYSLSTQEPIKKGGFALVDASFEGRDSYAQWVFMATDGRAVSKSAAPASAVQPAAQ